MLFAAAPGLARPLARQEEAPPRWASYARAFAEADEALGRGALGGARAAFERCLELSPANPTVAYGLASTESRAGEREAALAWLERAIEWGFRDGSLARWDEDLAALHGEARFVKLLEGLPEATVEQPRMLVEPPEDSPWPRAVSIDPAGERVLVGYDDGTLELLDVRAGELVRSLRPRESTVWKTVFSPDGASFAALFHDGTLGIWKTAGGEAVLLGRAVGESRRAEQWREAMGVEDLGPYEAGARAEWSFGAVLAPAPAGERLVVAAGEDRGAGLWTWSGERVIEWDLEELPQVSYRHVPLVWSPDGGSIALATLGSDVRFFDGRTGAERSRLSCPSPIRTLDFHPAGERMATGHDDGYVREWKLADGSLLWERSVEKEYEDVVSPDEGPSIGWVSYSPDGRALACTTVVVVYTIVLDLESRAPLWVGPQQGGRMGEPAELAWSPDGTRLWSTYLSGLPLLTVDFGDRPAKPVTWPFGFVPRFSAHRTERGEPELGVTILNGTHVTLLQAHDGAVRWMRTRDAQGAVLLQTAGGRLAAALDDFRGWTVGPRSNEHGDPAELGPRIEGLLDPKRVRASCAGVR